MNLEENICDECGDSLTSDAVGDGKRNLCSKCAKYLWGTDNVYLDSDDYDEEFY